MVFNKNLKEKKPTNDAKQPLVILVICIIDSLTYSFRLKLRVIEESKRRIYVLRGCGYYISVLYCGAKSMLGTGYCVYFC